MPFVKLPLASWKMPPCKMSVVKMPIIAVPPIHFINQMSDKLALSFVNLPFSQGTKKSF
jgi:hypothetical protein